VSTALEVECATVVALKQCPLLPLKCPSVDLNLLILNFPLSLDADPHLFDLFISAYNLSTVLLFAFCPLFLVNAFSIYFFILIRAIVLQVL
jgi:hypothetical protein